jgi:DNA-binding GntR family transcriptional regulator
MDSSSGVRSNKMDDPTKLHQIKNDLLRQLDEGVLEPGDEVIGRYEAEDYGVSAQLVRNVLRSLAREGRLERRNNRYVVPDQVIDNSDPLLPVRRATKWEPIAATLRDKITIGEIGPGAMLSGKRLADEYGVNRETMRRALRTLMHEEMIKVYKGYGYLVTRQARQAYDRRSEGITDNRLRG